MPPNSLEFEGFALIRGEYETIQPNEQGWLWSQQLDLHPGIYNQKLRFFPPNGDLVQTPKKKRSRTKRYWPATGNSTVIYRPRPGQHLG